MRLKAGSIALGVVFLLMTGFRPEALPFSPRARFSDAVVTHWPSALYLRESLLERNAFPIWRETIMAGQPFAANPLNKTAYPLQWFVLLFPPALHLDLMIALHLLLAGWGMWRWVGALGLREEAAALSALTYTLTPKLVGHLGAGHLDIVYALAWWPWLMWSLRQASSQSVALLTATLQTSLFAALLLLADIRLSLFALSLAAVYGIASDVRLGSRKQIFRRMLIFIPFLLMTASVLVPLLVWQPYLSRAALTPTEAGVFSLEWAQLAGMILPAHAGNFETVTYLGLPVLVLASVAVTAEPRKHMLWLALTVFAGLYALGTNGGLWPLLVNFEPGLLWFRVPSRAWFVVALVASLLAGYGLQYLIQTTERLRCGDSLAGVARSRLMVVGGMAGALVCGGYTLLTLDALQTSALSVLIGAGGLGAVLLAALSGRLNRQILVLALIGLTFLDLAWTGRHWLEWRGTESWLQPQQALAERLLEFAPARIYSPTYSIEQQVAAVYGLRLFGGVDPFQLSGVVEAIERGGGVVSEGYSVVLPPLIGANSDDEIALANHDAMPDTEVLAEWSVSHVVAAYPLEHPRLQLVDIVDGNYIYANQDFSPESSPVTGDWPAGWPGLPDRDTVERLNQQTMVAAFVSGASFIVVAAALLALKARS